MNNREIILKWIEALRSGTFTQGRGYLKRDDFKEAQTKYCCLGVLCTIHPHVKETAFSDVGLYAFQHATDAPMAESYSTLTTKLRESLGITQGEQLRLMQMNDQDESPFSKIADYIEEEILPRFST